LIFVGGVVSSFIDTDYMWSLNIKRPMNNIAIDTKSKVKIYLRGLHRHLVEFGVNNL